MSSAIKSQDPVEVEVPEEAEPNTDTNYELVENLTANINSLANLDLATIGNNINL